MSRHERETKRLMALMLKGDGWATINTEAARSAQFLVIQRMRAALKAIADSSEDSPARRLAREALSIDDTPGAEGTQP